MKKYLMTGFAALAICAAFTSCSKSEDLFNPDQVEENAVQQVYNNYNEAFIATFGQPASNQNWGFVDYTKSSTREAHTYMNGNMEKYYDAPLKGDSEEKDVEAYVHALTSLPAKAAPDWQNYFVTQIHDGEKEYNTQKTVDGKVEYIAGRQMDELAFAMQESAVLLDNGLLDGEWIHINNFNNANNTDWNGNTLVEDGGTFDFAYKSSADSKYHNRWIGIDGKDIPNSQGVKGDYDNYYYICFDFESTGNAKTVIKWRDADKTPRDAYLFGAWTSLDDVPEGTTIYNTRYNPETNSEEFIPSGHVYLEEGAYEWQLDNVVNGNMVVIGNNDYTDWIIRLYKAREINDEPDPKTWDIRIIGEDLNATAQAGDTEDSDWDFNDVVIDVDFTGDNTCDIRIVAAGGTLPLIVGVANPTDGVSYDDKEIHHLLGQPVSVMVNTNAQKKGLPSATVAEANLPVLEDLTFTGVKAAHGANIPIYVEKVVNGQKKWFELKAQKGVPAAKIGVAPTFRIVDERNRIDSEGWYPLFSKWVASVDYVWY